MPFKNFNNLIPCYFPKILYCYSTILWPNLNNFYLGIIHFRLFAVVFSLLEFYLRLQMLLKERWTFCLFYYMCILTDLAIKSKHIKISQMKLICSCHNHAIINFISIRSSDSRHKHRHHHHHDHYKQEDLELRRQKGSEVHLDQKLQRVPTELDEATMLHRADLDEMASK